MEMYNIDFRRGDIPAENTPQSDPEANGESNTDINSQEYKPGCIPFDETDAGKMGGKPF